VPDADPIDLPRLRRELIRPAGRWRQIDLVSETGSTNADLSARVRAGEPVGSVLITDYQSAGRGRQGRRWTAPPGSGIAMSVSLAPEVDPDRWTWLPLLAGLAVAQGLERAIQQRGAPPRIDLKWPNDVLADGLKVCGILGEQIQTTDRPACVLGMGINVHLQADELPVPTATSLALLVGEQVPARTDLIVAVLARLEAVLTAWRDPRGTGVTDDYLARCTTIGRDVQVQLAAERSVYGQATGLDAEGCLIVRTASGPVILGAGDVVHVR
jgi:BirA family biotin operon repressor/biotin-[acetyl-CoA-carboxylase] ligase